MLDFCGNEQLSSSAEERVFLAIMAVGSHTTEDGVAQVARVGIPPAFNRVHLIVVQVDHGFFVESQFFVKCFDLHNAFPPLFFILPIDRTGIRGGIFHAKGAGN